MPFFNLGGNTPPVQTPPATPPAQTPPDQTPPTQAPPSTPTNTPPNTPPSTPPTTPPTTPPAQVDLGALFAEQQRLQSGAGGQLTPEQQLEQQFEQLFAEGLGGNQQPAQADNGIGLDPDLVRQHLEQHNPASAMDVNALVDALQSNGDNIGEQLQTFGANLVNSTVQLMLPMINELTARSAAQNQQQAVSAVNTDQKVNAVISSFNSQFNTGNNPLLSSIVQQFARMSVAQNASGDPAQIAKVIHANISKMAPTNGQEQSAQQPNIPAGAITDHSNLFG